jgi:hypothetical protein
LHTRNRGLAVRILKTQNEGSNVQSNVLRTSACLTLAHFDSPNNGGKSSSVHLSQQKRILLGEDLGVIITMIFGYNCLARNTLSR